MGVLKRNLGWIGLVLLLLGGLVSWVETPLRRAVASAPGLPFLGTVLVWLAALLLAAHLVVNWQRVRLFSRARASRYGANALLYTLCVAGILVVVNVFISRHDLRLDTTTERFHSLSPQSRKVLAALDGPVEALAFLGRNHPGRQPAEDLFRLMEEASHNRFRYELIDPVLEPTRTKELGVSQMTEILFRAGDQEARTTQITETSFMNTLAEATRPERVTVCFSTGHGERDARSNEQPGYAQIRQSLEDERYRTGEVNLMADATFGDLCDVVVIAGPSQPFLEGEIERIETFLKEGGGLLLLAEPKVELGLDALLERHGASIGNDQVVELYPLPGFGPFNPIGLEYGDHPISAPLDQGRISTVFFDARSAQPHERNVYRPENDGTCLVKTGEKNSYAESRPGVFTGAPDEEDRLGPICLGVAATHDPYEVPVEAGDSRPPEGLPVQRLVVFGDSDFANNFYVSQGGNRGLLLNSVAWLARRGELIDIRPRDRAARALLLDPTQMRLIAGVTLLGLPVIVLVGGLGLWFHRRRL